MDNIINNLFLILENKKSTHPHVSSLWINYLNNKINNYSLTNNDINDCLNAINTMNKIKDINPNTIYLIDFLLNNNNNNNNNDYNNYNYLYNNNLDTN